jgi:hypothetical protein
MIFGGPSGHTGMPPITPSLWFDGDLEEATKFYTSVFPNSSIEGFNRYTDAGLRTPGDVVSGSFVLDGTRFAFIKAMLGMRKIVVAELEAAADKARPHSRPPR